MSDGSICPSQDQGPVVDKGSVQAPENKKFGKVPWGKKGIVRYRLKGSSTE